MDRAEFQQRFAHLVRLLEKRDPGILVEIAGELENPSHDVRTRCYLRSFRAFVLARFGDAAAAESEALALLNFAQREGYIELVTQCHRALSECANIRGDQLSNRQHCVQALAAARQCDDSVLQYACELRVANVIGEWGRASHAAMLIQNLYETTDWELPGHRPFLAATLCVLAWWLACSGRPSEALSHLNAPACRTGSPYQEQLVETGIAFARYQRGDALETDALEILLARALEQGWLASSVELHWLLSHQAPDASECAKTHITLALASAARCTLDVHRMVLERGICCARARGDQHTQLFLEHRLHVQQEAVLHAEEVAPFECPLSGELLVE